MRIAPGAAALFGVALAASAARAAEPSCLETAASQAQIDACAATMAQAADQRLNKAYRDVLRYVGGKDRARLVAAQRAWIVFRDADCAFWGGGNGSIAPTNRRFCLAARSDERAKELDTWPPNAPRDALVPKR